MAVLEEKQAYAFPRKLYNFQPFMNRGRPQLFIKLDPKIRESFVSGLEQAQ